MKKLLSLLLLAVSFSMPAHADYTLWQTATGKDLDPGACADAMLQLTSFAAANLSIEAYNSQDRTFKCWFFTGSMRQNSRQLIQMNGWPDSIYGRLWSTIRADGIGSMPNTRLSVRGRCRHDIQISTWSGYGYDADDDNGYNSKGRLDTFLLTINTYPEDILSAKVTLVKTSYSEWASSLGLARCSAPAAR